MWGSDFFNLICQYSSPFSPTMVDRELTGLEMFQYSSQNRILSYQTRKYLISLSVNYTPQQPFCLNRRRASEIIARQSRAGQQVSVPRAGILTYSVLTSWRASLGPLRGSPSSLWRRWGLCLMSWTTTRPALSPSRTSSTGGRRTERSRAGQGCLMESSRVWSETTDWCLVIWSATFTIAGKLPHQTICWHLRGSVPDWRSACWGTRPSRGATRSQMWDHNL